MTIPVNTASNPAEPVGSAKPTERRWVLWGLLATGTMAAMAPAPPAPGRSAPEKARFVETYRGRRITGVRYGVGPSGDPCCEMWHVTVDGRPLPLMRRADGSWMTMVDHYQSYPTPLLAARAAVDELGPTARPAAPDGNDGRMDHSGERSEQPRSPKDHVHGVHA